MLIHRAVGDPPLVVRSALASQSCDGLGSLRERLCGSLRVQPVLAHPPDPTRPSVSVDVLEEGSCASPSAVILPWVSRRTCAPPLIRIEPGTHDLTDPASRPVLKRLGHPANSAFLVYCLSAPFAVASCLRSRVDRLHVRRQGPSLLGRRALWAQVIPRVGESNSGGGPCSIAATFDWQLSACASAPALAPQASWPSSRAAAQHCHMQQSSLVGHCCVCLRA